MRKIKEEVGGGSWRRNLEEVVGGETGKLRSRPGLTPYSSSDLDMVVASEMSSTRSSSDMSLPWQQGY